MCFICFVLFVMFVHRDMAPATVCQLISECVSCVTNVSAHHTALISVPGLRIIHCENIFDKISWLAGREIFVKTPFRDTSQVSWVHDTFMTGWWSERVPVPGWTDSDPRCLLISPSVRCTVHSTAVQIRLCLCHIDIAMSVSLFLCQFSPIFYFHFFCCRTRHGT